LEGPAEGINVQVFWVDPVIFSKTPQAREIWYNPHISDDRAHIWTNYITLDNYSFEELVERCHEPLEVEEDRYIREIVGIIGGIPDNYDPKTNHLNRIQLNSTNNKAFLTGAGSKGYTGEPVVMAILGRETKAAFQKRITAM